MEPISPAKHRLIALIALLAVSTVSFFIGLNNVGFIGPDEPRYAEVAREMFATGDYISPRLCGCLWFEKPPLLYWIAAAGYHSMGVGEFAARSASAVCALISILMVFQVVSRVASTGTAFACSIVLGTSLLYIGYARACATDMPLAATVTIALLSFYLSMTIQTRARLGYWLLGSAATGGAMLAKGLVGIVLVLGTLAGTWLLTRRRPVFSWQWLMAGAAICLLVAAVWYVPITLEHGQAFIREFFINHHFRRYVENRFQHPQPVYFFPFVMLAGGLPWTFFLVPAAGRLGALRRRDPTALDLLRAMCWVWLLFTVIFFSLSVSKLPGYVLPAFPALAIILGIEVERFCTGDRSRLLLVAVLATTAVLVAMAAAVPIYVHREALRVNGLDNALVWAPLAAALGTVYFIAGRRRRTFALGPALVSLCIVMAALYAVVPKIERELSSRRLSQVAAQSLRPGEKIAFYITKEYGPVFYSEGRVACGLRGEDVLNAYDPAEIIRALERESTLVVITKPEYRDDLENNPLLVSEPIYETSRNVVIRVGNR